MNDYTVREKILALILLALILIYLILKLYSWKELFAIPSTCASCASYTTYETCSTCNNCVFSNGKCIPCDCTSFNNDKLTCSRCQNCYYGTTCSVCPTCSNIKDPAQCLECKNCGLTGTTCNSCINASGENCNGLTQDICMACKDCYWNTKTKTCEYIPIASGTLKEDCANIDCHKLKGHNCNNCPNCILDKQCKKDNRCYPDITKVPVAEKAKYQAQIIQHLDKYCS